MQLIKKFNIRTTGILAYAIYSLFNTAISSSFSSYIKFQSMRFNSFHSITLKYFDISIILNSYIQPLLFIAFLFILYKVNSKQKGEKPLKVLGIIFISLELIVIFLSIERVFRSSLQLKEFYTIISFFLGVFSSIGFVLFVLSKYKKVMLIIYTIGLIYSFHFNIYIVNSAFNVLPKTRLTSFVINNSMDLSFWLYTIPNMIIGLFFGILIWFYCFFEIKNKQKGEN